MENQFSEILIKSESADYPDDDPGFDHFEVDEKYVPPHRDVSSDGFVVGDFKVQRVPYKSDVKVERDEDSNSRTSVNLPTSPNQDQLPDAETCKAEVKDEVPVPSPLNPMEQVWIPQENPESASSHPASPQHHETSEDPCQHSSTFFKCKICSVIFESEILLEIHMKITHPNLAPIPCPQCFKLYNNNTALKVHIRNVHVPTERNFICTQCDKKFKINCTLQKHIKTVHSSARPFACNECDFSFKNKATLNKHIKFTHSSERAFKCEECFRTFKRSYELSLHVKHTHSSERNFECPVCFAKMKRRNDYQHHMKYYHASLTDGNHIDLSHSSNDVDNNKKIQISPPNFICDSCDRGFKTKKILKVHITCVHLSGKRLKCKHCRRRFKTEYTLKIHTKNFHNTIITCNFICNQCSKVFKTMNDLKNHKKVVHTLEPRVKCTSCDKLLKNKYTLKTHVEKLHKSP